MGASCYLCGLNMAVFPSTSAGDAVGACKLCGVLACAGHAQRNRNIPAYECGICKPNVLAAAAARQLPASPPAGPPPAPPGSGGGGTPWAGDAPNGGYAQRAAEVADVADVIDDVDDARWQGLRDDVAYLERYLGSADMPQAMRAFGENSSARRLMAAAAALAIQLKVPTSEMTSLLAQAAAAVQVGSLR